MENKQEVSQLGYVAGGLAWLVLVYMLGTVSECVVSKSCDAGDFVLGAICAIALLGPAYIFAKIVTEVTKNN